MKKIALLVLALILILSFAAGTALAADVTYVKVTGSVVNLRSGPGTSYDKLGSVTKDTQLVWLSTGDGWYQVKTSSGQKAWISATYSELVSVADPGSSTPQTPSSSTPSGSAKTALVNTNSSNVRSGPSTSYSSLTKLSAGTEVTVLYFSDGWYQVRLADGTEGWISASLLDLGNSGSILVAEKERRQTVRFTHGQVCGSGKYALSSGTAGLIVKIQSSEPFLYEIARTSKGMAFYTDISLSGETNVSSYRASGVSSLSQTDNKTALLFSGSQKLYLGAVPSADGCTVTLTVGTSPLIGHRIVVDPGHGSYAGSSTDPGAVQNGLSERDINMAIGRALLYKLNAAGADARLTHDGPTSLDLYDRAWFANALEADAFVSVHCNSATNNTANGSSTYFYAPAGNTMGWNRSEHQLLAKEVQSELVAALASRNIGVKEERFVVIRETDMPSILVETLFISNPSEAAVLSDPDSQQQIAAAIRDGMANWFAAME